MPPAVKKTLILYIKGMNPFESRVVILPTVTAIITSYYTSCNQALWLFDLNFFLCLVTELGWIISKFYFSVGFIVFMKIENILFDFRKFLIFWQENLPIYWWDWNFAFTTIFNQIERKKSADLNFYCIFLSNINFMIEKF